MPLTKAVVAALAAAGVTLSALPLAKVAQERWALRSENAYLERLLAQRASAAQSDFVQAPAAVLTVLEPPVAATGAAGASPVGDAPSAGAGAGATAALPHSTPTPTSASAPTTQPAAVGVPAAAPPKAAAPLPAPFATKPPPHPAPVRSQTAQAPAASNAPKTASQPPAPALRAAPPPPSGAAARPAASPAGKGPTPVATSTGTAEPSTPAPPGTSPAQTARPAAVAAAAIAQRLQAESVGRQGGDASTLRSDTTQAAPTQYVSREASGIDAITASAVRLKSGREIQVGGLFPSGEKLLSVNPSSGEVTTDKRHIVVQDPG